MANYDIYDFTIHSEEELLELIRNVRMEGYPAFVYVNGIYYDFSTEYGRREEEGGR